MNAVAPFCRCALPLAAAAPIEISVPPDGGTPRDPARITRLGPAEFRIRACAEEGRSILWGDDVHAVQIPDLLSASVPLTDTLSYPVYRLFMSAVCVALAIGL